MGSTTALMPEHTQCCMLRSRLQVRLSLTYIQEVVRAVLLLCDKKCQCPGGWQLHGTACAHECPEPGTCPSSSTVVPLPLAEHILALLDMCCCCTFLHPLQGALTSPTPRACEMRTWGPS